VNGNLQAFLDCIEQRLHEDVPRTQIEQEARAQRAVLVSLHRHWLCNLFREAALSQGFRLPELFPGNLGDWNGLLSNLLDAYLSALAGLTHFLETGNVPPPFTLKGDRAEAEQARNVLWEVLKEIEGYAIDPTKDKQGPAFLGPLTDEEEDALFVHRALMATHRWGKQQHEQEQQVQRHVQAHLFAVGGCLLPLNTVAAHQMRTRQYYIDPCREEYGIPEDFR